MKTLLKITALSIAMGGMLQASSCFTANGCPSPCPAPVACPIVVLCPAPPPPPPPKVVVVCPSTCVVVEEPAPVECCVSACDTGCYCCD